MPKYTDESLRRALEHHGAKFQLPSTGDNETTKWLIDTEGRGTVPMTSKEVHAYVAGIADAERRFKVTINVETQPNRDDPTEMVEETLVLSVGQGAFYTIGTDGEGVGFDVVKIGGASS